MVTNSASPYPVFILLDIDSGSILGGISPIVESIFLGETIINIVDQSLHSGAK